MEKITLDLKLLLDLKFMFDFSRATLDLIYDNHKGRCLLQVSHVFMFLTSLDPS